MEFGGNRHVFVNSFLKPSPRGIGVAFIAVPTAHAQACSYLIIVRCFGRAGATLLVT